MSTSILAGVVVALLLQLASAGLGEFVAVCCLDAQYAPPPWYAVLSSPVAVLVVLAPGFLAGWLSHSKGILLGLVVGLLGHAIYAATMHTMWPTVIEDGAVIEMIIRLLALASSSALIGAAAGGAAQLLRSNKCFEPTRAKPRAAQT